MLWAGLQAIVGGTEGIALLGLLFGLAVREPTLGAYASDVVAAIVLAAAMGLGSLSGNHRRVAFLAGSGVVALHGLLTHSAHRGPVFVIDLWQLAIGLGLLEVARTAWLVRLPQGRKGTPRAAADPPAPQGLAGPSAEPSVAFRDPLMLVERRPASDAVRGRAGWVAVFALLAAWNALAPYNEGILGTLSGPAGVALLAAAAIPLWAALQAWRWPEEWMLAAKELVIRQGRTRRHLPYDRILGVYQLARRPWRSAGFEVVYSLGAPPPPGTVTGWRNARLGRERLGCTEAFASRLSRLAQRHRDSLHREGRQRAVPHRDGEPGTANG